MDARLSERVVTDPALDGISDRAFRVWCMALAWSAGQDADGRIPARALRLLHPEGQALEAAVELVAAGVWREVRGGYANVHGQDWQTPGAEARAMREASAERSRKYRQRKREEASGEASRERHAPKTPNVTPTVTRSSREESPVENAEKPAAKGQSGPNVTREITRDVSRDDVGKARQARPPEGKGSGEGEDAEAVIFAVRPRASEARGLPGAWQAAARNGWSPGEYASALDADLSPSASPAVITTAARAVAERPPPSRAKADAAARDVTRSAAPDCQHDTPHGTYLHPKTGEPICPKCREQTRAAAS